MIVEGARSDSSSDFLLCCQLVAFFAEIEIRWLRQTGRSGTAVAAAVVAEGSE